MIAYVKGMLSFKSPAYVVVDCNGIGYHVNISLNTYAQIPEKGEVKLMTYLSIKEDAHTLYGFADELEKNLFIRLISVKGIGPSTGRMVLSTLSPDELVEAILAEDVKTINRVKGVGPKSAKMIIVELKDKIGKDLSEDSIKLIKQDNTLKNEALSALQMLGFTRTSGEKAIAAALKSNATPESVESLIKIALKNL